MNAFFFYFHRVKYFFPRIRTAAAPWIVSPPVVSFSAFAVVLPAVSAFCSSEDFGARRRFFFSSPELLVSACCCCCRSPEP
jgi:hypothetical protein